MVLPWSVFYQSLKALVKSELNCGLKISYVFLIEKTSKHSLIFSLAVAIFTVIFLAASFEFGHIGQCNNI